MGHILNSQSYSNKNLDIVPDLIVTYPANEITKIII